jgi:prepilin-type N-terminal cleavage/methylation domain-containing protein
LGAFTLIEVLISLVILSTGIVLVLRAFNTSLFALRESRNALIANILIRDKIEQARLAAFERGDAGLDSQEGNFGTIENFEGEMRVDRLQTSWDGSNTLNKVSVVVSKDDAHTEYGVATYITTSKASKQGM